jgi:CPA2 family monovalent cation:H+ antiporter-2
MDQTFLSKATIFLAAALIVVPIAKRLGLGSVLGYLIAGVLIGPYALRFVGEEGQDIMHFAEFGVVMMLFVIGLELEPSRLWRIRKAIAGLGGLQVVLTTAIVAAGAVIAGLAWRQAIAVGVVAAMSSTAIVMQMLAEKGQSKTTAGQSSFAVLLFQDIAVIPILALLPLLASEPPHSASPTSHHSIAVVAMLPAWAQAVAVLGAVGAVILAGRYLMHPLLHLVARTGLREMFTAVALLLVAGIATLMTTVGLSPALGTFLAGVVLANSEYRHELESDIDPFKGLLLGLFFIAVGASINFGLIAQRPTLVFGLVAAIMVAKALVLALLGRLFQLRLTQSLLFSLGLCQIGEFAFVLLNFTVQERVLPQDIADVMVAVVAITMVLTPLVMFLNDEAVQPRLSGNRAAKDQTRPDLVEQDNQVIIAGYGHFGLIVGRFLRANRIETTVLDEDSDNVKLLREMGFKVFYGDASRRDLLEIAGARTAKLIVIAIGNKEKRLEMVRTIKVHFPDLRILIRAENRYDAYALMKAGVTDIYRETLDTSLRVGVDAMRALGFRAYETQRMAKTFFTEDERALASLAESHGGSEYLSAFRRWVREIESTLHSDQEALAINIDRGWDGRKVIDRATAGPVAAVVAPSEAALGDNLNRPQSKAP